MKERMITRTIATVNAEIMGIETSTSTVSNVNYKFVGYEFKNDNEIIEAAKKDSIEGFIPVKVVSLTTTEKLYGMSETMFLQYAKELPPRKVYES